jgi:hypothetical protein
VGPGSYEKDLRLARIALIGALRRLDSVMASFEKSDIELWPNSAGDVPAWTAEHLALVKAAAARWTDLARRRMDYDSAARTVSQPSVWPHA